MSKPRIFIGSSSEGFSIAETIQDELNAEFDCVNWRQAGNGIGLSILEWLMEESLKYDYAIFVYAADDIAEIRGEKVLAARDNVILEHGLFLGRLGRERVFFITPDERNLHLPSDLAGVLHGKFRTDLFAVNGRSAVSPFCRLVKDRIKTAEGQLVRLDEPGKVWEVQKMSDAHSGSVRFEQTRRIEYEPINFSYRADQRRNRVTVKYRLKMAGQGVEFDGDVSASGRLDGDWAYLIYEGVDRNTGHSLTGVCVMNNNWGRRSEAYWMTADELPDNPHGIVLGAAVSTRKLPPTTAKD